MEGITLTFIFMGLAIAVMTSHTKAGVLLSGLATVFYFYLVDFNSWIPIVLFILGLLLVVTEVLIPDFGLIGFLGIASVIGGLYLTLGDLGQTIQDMSIAIVITAGLVLYLAKQGYSLANFSRFVLTSSEENQQSKKKINHKLEEGNEGISETTLRPSGKAIFNEEDGLIYDVLSAEGHISKGTPIVIEKISGTKILVRKLKKKGD